MVPGGAAIISWKFINIKRALNYTNIFLFGESALSIAGHREGQTLFATVEQAGIRCYLVVEPLPLGGGWDWTVWRHGAGPRKIEGGFAPAEAEAMAAAEAAARR